jgi:hypothetical protein
MSEQPLSVLRLRVAAESDPGALAQILSHFQNLNILPRKVVAEIATNGIVHVEVDITGLSGDAMTLIAAQIGEAPCILSSRWHWA